MARALEPSMLATELADYLVRKGVPFRETHHISGRVVALAEKEGKGMDELSVAQLQGVDERFGDDARGCFDYEAAVEGRTAEGGTARGRVMEQVEALKMLLETGKMGD